MPTRGGISISGDNGANSPGTFTQETRLNTAFNSFCGVSAGTYAYRIDGYNGNQPEIGGTLLVGEGTTFLSGGGTASSICPTTLRNNSSLGPSNIVNVSGIWLAESNQTSFTLDQLPLNFPFMIATRSVAYSLFANDPYVFECGLDANYTTSVDEAWCMRSFWWSWLKAPANAFAQNLVVFSTDTSIPIGQYFTFYPAAAVGQFFGTGSTEDTLATGFFAGYGGSTANITFVRTAVGGGRSRVFSSTFFLLSQPSRPLRAEPLTYTMDGFPVTVTGLNFTGQNTGALIATTLAAGINSAVAADTLGTITTGSVAANSACTFTATIAAGVMTVSAVATNCILNNTKITGTGYSGQIVSQISGTAGGVGTYSVFYVPGQAFIGPETITQSYGTFTATTVASGTLSVGQHLADSGGLLRAPSLWRILAGQQAEAVRALGATERLGKCFLARRKGLRR